MTPVRLIRCFEHKIQFKLQQAPYHASIKTCSSMKLIYPTTKKTA
jgi:hypothetical protein